MKLGYLAYRNLISKPWNLVFNLILLVLSISLVLFILQITRQLNEQLDKNIAPVDMVVGAKGSPLQLVLSSVLHIDAPTGNIKLEDAEKLKKHPYVGSAIPVSYGDNYKGNRILGTELKYFEAYNAFVSEGRLFKKSFEIVVGSSVARKLSIAIGDQIISSHGLVDSAMDEAHEDKPYTVVGILEPSGTVIDNLLICNLESIWQAHDHDHDHEKDDHNHDGDHEDDDHNHDGDHDHDHDGDHEDHDHDHEHDHDHDLEITSLLVKFKNPVGLIQLPRSINENTNMQAALPSYEIQRLAGLLGAGATTINSIAIAILLVSGLSIFISMLKTIRERRKELALLRTYGWGTLKLLYLVLIEGILLALFGFVIGWILSRLAIYIASSYLEKAYGYVLQLNGPDTAELYLLIITMILTIVAVFLASTAIFKLNISKILSNE